MWVFSAGLSCCQASVLDFPAIAMLVALHAALIATCTNLAFLTANGTNATPT